MKLGAHVAQSAERVLGKDEVTSSNLVMGSTRKPANMSNLNYTENKQNKD